MVEKEVDCFGCLYDETIDLCRKRCAVASECKKEVKKRLTQAGAVKFNDSKKRVLLTNKEQPSKKKKHKSLEPEISQTVSDILDVCKSYGLSVVYRSGYIAIKDDNRLTLLSCYRFKAEGLYGSVGFVRIRNRNKVSRRLQKYLSRRRQNKSYYFTGKSLAELQKAILIYLKYVGAECEVKRRT